jgi:hypothetical protein
MSARQQEERRPSTGREIMVTALAEKTCTPCRSVPPLAPEATERFRAQVPEWAALDGATQIERTYRSRISAGCSPS